MKKITINGKTIPCTGSKVYINNGNVFVDGKVIQECSGDINIIIDGDVNGVECNGNVEIHGNAWDIKCGGSCNVKGNVTGYINASSSVTCGDVTGDIDAAGPVSCGDVGGNINIGSFGAAHERCSECEKDHIIAELEARDKPQKVLYRKQSYGTPWLCPVCEADQSEVQFIDIGGATTGGKYSFCWACGQKLDWDVEEHKED
nr:MAG TPA: hypothetical protein [Caudoviricetes sp.]